jgi:hypothetical protein
MEIKNILATTGPKNLAKCLISIFSLIHEVKDPDTQG